MITVNGPDPLKSTSGVKKKGSIANPDGSFSSLMDTGETVSAQSTIPTQPLGMIEGLLAIQEVEEDFFAQKKAVKDGGKLLDYLDEIRHGLLSGGISTLHVRNLMHTLKSFSLNISDPQLLGILREIETRGAVELAKIEMSQKSEERL